MKTEMVSYCFIFVCMKNYGGFITDMPVVILNSSKSLGKPTSIQTGKEAIEEILNKYKN